MTGTYPSADPRVPVSCARASVKKTPASDPGFPPECDRAAAHTRKADTNKACTARQARPLSQAPDSEPTPKPRSTAWCEIGQRPPLMNYDPASIVAPYSVTPMFHLVYQMRLKFENKAFK